MPYIEEVLICEQCNISSQQTGSAIKKCSKCGIVAYCSVKCQKEGWKDGGHKFECRRPEQADASSSRAVARLSFGSTAKAESTLYYCRVSRPWLDAFYLSGPFKAIEETYSNIARNMRFSRSGMLYFEQMCAEGVMDRAAHIRAPLDADKNKEIFIEILRREDSGLKKQLPCPVYNVICMEPAENLDLRTGPDRLKSMSLVGSFTSKTEAEAALRQEVDKQSSRMPETTSICPRFVGELKGVVQGRGGELKRFVQIVYDHGQTDDNKRYVEPPCVCQAHPEVIEQVAREVVGRI